MARKKANGEGTIRQRKNGKWEGRFTYGRDPFTGKQMQRSVYGTSHKEIQQKIREALIQVNNDSYINPTNLTLGEWLDTWLKTYQKNALKETTYNNYLTLTQKHIVPYIGKMQLCKIKTIQLQKLYNKLEQEGRIVRKESQNQPKGLSAKTVRNIHSILYSAFEAAIRANIINQNPAKYCSLPKKEHREMIILPLDMLDKFFVEAMKTEYFPLYYMDLSTGLRRGELLGLKYGDINFETGVLNISRQLQRINGKLVTSSLKTKHSRRSIQLPDETLAIIKEHKEKQMNLGLLPEQSYIDDRFIFCSPFGTPLDPDSARKMLKRILKRAELPELRFHDLRHTFSALALQNGVDIKSLQKDLGHHSAAFTLDVYGHITPQMEQQKAKKIGDFLSSQIKKIKDEDK
jgi:integrase